MPRGFPWRTVLLSLSVYNFALSAMLIITDLGDIRLRNLFIIIGTLAWVLSGIIDIQVEG